MRMRLLSAGVGDLQSYPQGPSKKIRSVRGGPAVDAWGRRRAQACSSTLSPDGGAGRRGWAASGRTGVLRRALKGGGRSADHGDVSATAPVPAEGRSEVAVVRHPIADARHVVVGYELRFGGTIDLGDPSMDAKATSALLVDAFGDIGLETLAGRHPAWVTIARNFLVEIGPPPVRPDRAVLQIKAYQAQDDLLVILQQLARSGYTIALDDYSGQMA